MGVALGWLGLIVMVAVGLWPLMRRRPQRRGEDYPSDQWFQARDWF